MIKRILATLLFLVIAQSVSASMPALTTNKKTNMEITIDAAQSGLVAGLGVYSGLLSNYILGRAIAHNDFLLALLKIIAAGTVAKYSADLIDEVFDSERKKLFIASVAFGFLVQPNNDF